MHAKFHENWFRHSEVDRGDTQTHREHGDPISLILFFNKGSRVIKIGMFTNNAEKKTNCNLATPLIDTHNEF
jgi:hypothetical protein